MAFRQSTKLLLRNIARQKHYRSYSNNNGSQREYSSFNSAAAAGTFLSAASAAIYLNYINAEPVHASSIEEPVRPWHGLSLELYMYYGCPFCSKLEAFLKFKQIPYKRIEVNAMTKSEVKAAGKPYGGYKKVPFMIATVEATGEKIPLKDSSRIISLFESFRIAADKSPEYLHHLADQCYAEYERTEDAHTGEPLNKPEIDFRNVYYVMYSGSEDSYHAPSKKTTQDMIKWRTWIQDKLLHTIAPNLYPNMSEAITSTKHFTSISPRFAGTWSGTSVNYIGGPAMKFIGDMIKKKYNISKDPRDDLYKYCNEWVKNLPASGFMSDRAEPGIADLEAFGVLVILEGTQAYRDMMMNCEIGDWYMRVRTAIAAKQQIKPSDDCFLVPATQRA